jgi:predicted phage-related endonuclease
VNRYSKIKDFHGSRVTGVGSSDIPILAGYAKKYDQTPYTLWRLKTGLDMPQDAGPRAEWGHRLEGLVLAKFLENRYKSPELSAEFLHFKLRGKSFGPLKNDTECKMDGRPYVMAHADLVVSEAIDLRFRDDIPSGTALEVEPYIVEAKTAGFFSAKRDDDDPDSGYSKTDFSQNGIPAAVFLQVQWQLLAYDVREAWVAVLIDTGDYREYGPIIADPRTQEKILTLAERFWRCVETKTEPKPETWSDIGLMWPDPKNTSAMIGGDEEIKTREMIDEYHALKARGKDIDARVKDITNALGILIGDNRTLVTAEGVKLASSWPVNSPSIGDLAELPKAGRDMVALRPELAREWVKLEEERAKVAAKVTKIAEIIHADPELNAAGIIKDGWRVLRPAKIKGGEN